MEAALLVVIAAMIPLTGGGIMLWLKGTVSNFGETAKRLDERLGHVEADVKEIRKDQIGNKSDIQWLKRFHMIGAEDVGD